MIDRTFMAVLAGLGILGTVTATSHAQQFAITDVSISPLRKANLCRELGGGEAPPTIVVKHSKGQGKISVTTLAQYSGLESLGSISVDANPSGTTVVHHYRGRPPCGQKKTRYTVAASAGASQKTAQWGEYP